MSSSVWPTICCTTPAWRSLPPPWLLSCLWVPNRRRIEACLDRRRRRRSTPHLRRPIWAPHPRRLECGAVWRPGQSTKQALSKQTLPMMTNPIQLNLTVSLASMAIRAQAPDREPLPAAVSLSVARSSWPPSSWVWHRPLAPDRTPAARRVLTSSSVPSYPIRK